VLPFVNDSSVPSPVDDNSSRCFSYVHARCASCDLATLPQTIRLALSVRLVLADHVIIVVRLASGTNKVCGAQQWSRTGSYFGDLWNVIWKRSGVNEDALVESGRLSTLEVQYKKLFNHLGCLAAIVKS